MTANELRIGNWVLNKNGRHIQVNRDMLGIVLILKSIPLTPEVLEKCGIWNFKTEKSIDGIYFLFAFSYGLDGSSKIASVSVIQDDDIITLRHIEHLHQLQNIYSDFTNGEELQYTP